MKKKSIESLTKELAGVKNFNNVQHMALDIAQKQLEKYRAEIVEYNTEIREYREALRVSTDYVRILLKEKLWLPRIINRFNIQYHCEEERDEGV